MKKKCCFCSMLLDSYKSNINTSPWNQILFQSSNFVVIPTIGSIVEGWLLIVSKKHIIRMATLQEKLLVELEELSRYVSSVLKNCYSNDVTVFEHGPASPNLEIGCGVDHAHLHVLPLNWNILEEARKIFPECSEWQPIENMRELKKYHLKGHSYLYVEQQTGNPFIMSHPRLPGKFFRKVIANRLGCPEHFNWQKFPEQINVIMTVEKLNAWKATNNLSSINQCVMVK